MLFQPDGIAVGLIDTGCVTQADSNPNHQNLGLRNQLEGLHSRLGQLSSDIETRSGGVIASSKTYENDCE
jgi:hypothetical protein